MGVSGDTCVQEGDGGAGTRRSFHLLQLPQPGFLQPLRETAPPPPPHPHTPTVERFVLSEAKVTCRVQPSPNLGVYSHTSQPPFPAGLESIKTEKRVSSGGDVNPRRHDATRPELHASRSADHHGDGEANGQNTVISNRNNKFRGHQIIKGKNVKKTLCRHSQDKCRSSEAQSLEPIQSRRTVERREAQSAAEQNPAHTEGTQQR